MSSGSPDRTAAETDFILITGNGHITQAQKQQLHDLGCEPYEYIGNKQYLCKYKPDDWAPITHLPFIERVDPHKYSLGILEAELESGPATGRSRGGVGAEPLTKTVDISLHKGGASPEQVQAQITRETGGQIQASDMELVHRGIRLTTTLANIKLIAERIDSVKSIEPVIPRRIYNNVARQDIQDQPGFLINNTKYEGENHVVAVADTGFDLGVTKGKDLHPAFTNQEKPGESRVLRLYPIGRSTANDIVGHGTHVAGSILGDGVCTDEDKALGGQIRGTAPKASLVLQALVQDNGKNLSQPSNLWELFYPPYDKYKARVASNSWGPKWDEVNGPPPYDTTATAIDSFVWHNPDHVILFAAGNDFAEAQKSHEAGYPWYPAQIGGESAAKNCITVGATYSTRPHKGAAYDPTQSPGNPSEITFFSSRGPTPEKRLKPDIVCPGNAILSTASRDPTAAKNREKWLENYGKVDDTNWAFCSGTSMATPIAAGCVTVLREALLAHHVESPSAALVKALLINGADDTGNDPTMQGYGRVNLQTLTNFFPLGPSTQTWHDDKATLAEGENRTYEVQVGAGQTLKVTLAYSDRKGKELQNNLTLKVTAANGLNKEDKQQIAENNVEQVVWEGIPAGKAVIEVTAERIARLNDKQPFALVWRVI